MLRIEWDNSDLEKQIKTWSSYSIMDYWISIYIYVGDIEISGLEDVPDGDVTHIITFFPDLLSIIQLFDPPRLLNLHSFKGSGIRKNLISEGGFNFTFDYENQTDTLTINYSNKVVKEWRKVTIPLREYTDGVLRATKEMISDIQRIASEKSVDDNFLISLKMHYNTIQSWYEERYHEPVEEKYVIPQEYL